MSNFWMVHIFTTESVQIYGFRKPLVLFLVVCFVAMLVTMAILRENRCHHEALRIDEQ